MKVVKLFILVCIFAVLFIPVLMMISNSLTPVKAFLTRPPRMWPRNFTLENYRQIFAMPLLPRWVLNTVIIVSAAVSSAMIVNGAAGYVFAFAKFKFLKPAFALALLPIFCTSYVMIIPRFVIVNRLGLNGTAAVIMMGIYWPMGIYLFRNYFTTVPKSFIENARLDGAKEWQIFWYIVLPICKPILGACIVFLSLGIMHDWVWQLLNLVAKHTQTFLVGLMMSTQEAFIVKNHGYNLAVGTTLFIPPIIIFAFTSRYFVKGLTSGAVKG